MNESTTDSVSGHDMDTGGDAGLRHLDTGTESESEDLRQRETWHLPTVVTKVSDIFQTLVSRGFTDEEAEAIAGKRYDDPDPKTGKRMFYEGIGYALQQHGCAIVMDGTDEDPIVFHSFAYSHAIKNRPKPKRYFGGK
jgi:hypothetical protein